MPIKESIVTINTAAGILNTTPLLNIIQMIFSMIKHTAILFATFVRKIVTIHRTARKPIFPNLAMIGVIAVAQNMLIPVPSDVITLETKIAMANKIVKSQK